MQSTVRFHMNPDEVNLAHNTDEKVRAREKHVKREHKRLAYEIVTSCDNISCEKGADGTVRYDKNNRRIRPQEVHYGANYAVNKRYYETFEERNPDFKIMSFAWHSDEDF
ncbi:MAG: hypothetical protein NC253_10655 [Ruminococcus sp.]|nr:hypothetical protein [Ruminococcus sp.]